MAPAAAKTARKTPSKATKKFVVAEKLRTDGLPNQTWAIPKDETEERLEKLIFGDEAGFLDSLKVDESSKALIRQSHPNAEEEHAENDWDLEGVADEDVQFASMLLS